ncbi:MAG: hypothetical protein F4Y45_14200 [Acidobacteria bacterium]|nr:hypothetical protein [Acidobacteriota bacterium]MYJ02962.1 hypothetical protein [Acidobacteriota bacterium]
MTTIFRGTAIAILLLMAAGCAEDTLRLRARFITSCAVGETESPAPFGDGRIGVNTTFRAAASATPFDQNILDLYFHNTETGETETPGGDVLAGRVWVVDEHDAHERYFYREEGVVVCYRINE